MESVVIVIVNIVFIIPPNVMEKDHTFPGIWREAGMSHAIGEEAPSSRSFPCTRVRVTYPQVKFGKPEQPPLRFRQTSIYLAGFHRCSASY